jgi:hypothetical protein
MAEVGIDSCLVTAAKIPEAAPPTSSQCPLTLQTQEFTSFARLWNKSCKKSCSLL